MNKKKHKKKDAKKIQKKEGNTNINNNKKQDYIGLPHLSKFTSIDIAAIILITTIFGYLYFTNINAYDSLMYDEAGYITMGRTLAVEHYHGIDVQGTKESYRQPFFPLMIATSFILFGITYTAAKIPIIATAIITMIIVYTLIQKIYDRKIAFFSAAMIGGIPLVLKYIQNILSDVPSMLFYTLSMLAFYIGIEKKNPKYLYIAWFSFGLTFLIRYNAILIIPSIAIYLTIKIMTKEMNLKTLAKDKHFILSPIAALITIGPYFIYQQITFGNAFIGIMQARGALNMVWGKGPWHYYITQAPQYLTWLGLILVILGIGWTLYKKDRFGIYMLSWIIVPFAYFSSQILKDIRLIDTLAPPLAIFAALGAFNVIETVISRDMKLKNSSVQLIVPTVMLIYIIHSGYTSVLPQYQHIHALGYPSLAQAGEWIQENTEKDAILMTASEPGHQWYSYRKTSGYPKEEEFLDTINKKGIDYIIIDDYERMQPEYVPTLFFKTFLTQEGRLKHPQDIESIIITGDPALYDQKRIATTIIIPAELFVERMIEQQSNQTSPIEDKN